MQTPNKTRMFIPMVTLQLGQPKHRQHNSTRSVTWTSCRTNIPLHIAAALKRPSDDTPITVSTITLTPEDCQDILTYLSYHRQRNIKPAHVGNIADMMLNVEFAPGSMLTFALDENGQQVLVDGQHRLQAAVTADWTGEWTIRCLWHSGYTAYHIYTVLDTAQSQRTAAVIGRAQATTSSPTAPRTR